MNRFTAILKRDFLEHQTSYVILPGVITGLMVAAFAFSIFALQIHGVHGDIQVDGHAYHVNDLRSMLEGGITNVRDNQLSKALTAALFVAAVPVLLIWPFVVLFNLLSALYDERRDRSILFWKSMPVPDWMEVMGRVSATLILSTASLVVFGVAAQFMLLMLSSLFLAVNGMPGLALLWTNAHFITPWIGLLMFLTLWVLWAAPILGWLTIVSAKATRAPIMVAIVPLVAVSLIEGIMFRTSNFGEWIGLHLGGWLEVAHKLLGNITINLVEPGALGKVVSLYGVSLTQPQLWIGFIVAAALFFGATWVRRWNMA